MRRSLYSIAGTGLVAGAVLCGGSIVQACTIDQRPSASANGALARLNLQQPTTAAQLAVWAPFVFARSYAPRQTIALTEDRAQLAHVLVPRAMQRPWRWSFTDGSSHTAYNTIAYGWTVQHTFAHPGQWQVSVDAYDPISKKWYPFDQVAIVIRR